MEKVLTNTSDYKQRDFQFDVARSFAVLYVVGYYHLIPGYMDEETIKMFTGECTYIFILSVLGLFMFVSGYFLSNYRFENLSDVKKFYLKRIKRFYPLYFIALITMYLGGWIPSFKIFLLSSLGLSAIITPQPNTLWFFSMLVLFYILTPLLMMNSNRDGAISNLKLKQALRMICVGGVFLLLDKVLHIDIDQKIYWCFTCYSLGLLTGAASFIKKLTSNRFYWIGFLLIYCMTIDKTENHVFCIVNIMTGILCILCFSNLVSLIKELPYRHIIGFISYSSMCAYLFHRHIYKLGRLFYDGGIIPFWYGLLLLLPLVFIVSYYIQKSYDVILKKTEAQFGL